MIYLHGGAFALPVQQSALELAAVYAKALRMPVFLPEYRLLPELQRRDNLGRLSCPVALAGQRRERRKVCAGQRTYAALRGERRGSAGGGTDALAAGSEKKGCPAGVLLVYPVLDDRDGDTGQGKNGKEETGQGGQGGTGKQICFPNPLRGGRLVRPIQRSPCGVCI